MEQQIDVSLSLALKSISKLFLKYYKRALAGVAQWVEHGPVDQRVTGSIPRQSTCPGCGSGPQWGVHERQPHIDVSLFFSLPLSNK